MKNVSTINIAIDLISKLESFRSTPYKDLKGIITLGFGSTRIDGRLITMSDFCTREQAKLWLKTRVEEDFNKLQLLCDMHNISLEDNQAAAVLSFTYNAGWKSFLNSSMVRDLIFGKIEKVTSDLMQWNKIRVNGSLNFSQGLENRRLEEAQCFIDEKRC